MFGRRRTLKNMNRNALIAYTADLALEQGGDEEAMFAVLRNQLPGTELVAEDDDLCQGQMFALCAAFVYEELGPDAVRAILERRRAPEPVAPVRRGPWGNGWGGDR